eukprot:254477_1
MTSAALSLGCALLAFSPTLTLLLLFAYSKAQLVIVVTTAAFAQLLSCLLSALLHLPFKALGGSGTLTALFVIIPTSVVSQFLCRCGFVWLYHKVERVVEQSIMRHEALVLEAENIVDRRNNVSSSNRLRQESGSGDDNNGNGSHDRDTAPLAGSTAESKLSETAQLRLELNDVSAGLAAGVGFGFMHTVMLYGTLLAAENSRMGTLYQDSCTFMPSIFNSAIMAFLFGILDICWMFATFYGVRRFNTVTWNSEQRTLGFQFQSSSEGTSARRRLGGKAILILVAVSHASAAFATLPNQAMDVNGCVIALPSLALVTILTIAGFWFSMKNNYLPVGQGQESHHGHFD